jgi:mRNA-degrading endonuclease toxin of MazEF toxin-antitoxin module
LIGHVQGHHLPRASASVANVSQVVSVDRANLGERVEKLPETDIELVLNGIDLVLGRE